MKVLKDVSVLLVGEQLQQFDLLTVWLRSEGAQLRTSSYLGAHGQLADVAPTVVVMDTTQEAGLGQQLLRAIRATKAWAQVPAIALVDRTSSSAAPLDPGGPAFNKSIALPVHPADLVSSIVGLAPASATADAEPSRQSVLPAANRAELLAGFLRKRAEKNDMRGLLQLLNATGPFRFTSILRFEGEQLASVWTFDREAPNADSFPVDKTAAESYCSLVRATGAAVALPDVASVPGLAEHPARHTVLSYCGVPLRRDDESFYGTLCHFDLSPRMFAESTVKRLEETATLLRAHLPADPSVPQGALTQS